MDVKQLEQVRWWAPASACETARRNPNRVVVLILVDAVTGAAWDRRIRNVRRLPLLFAPLATEFLQDFAGLLARIRETDRSADLIRLGFDTYIGHVEHPMRSFAPVTLSLIKAPPSVPLLEEIARAGVATVVIWGDQDRLVSRACAESSAEITNARLIVVKDSGHSWPLQNRHTAKHIESLADERAPDSLGILLSKVVAQHARVNPPKPDQPVRGVQVSAAADCSVFSRRRQALAEARCSNRPPIASHWAGRR